MLQIIYQSTKKKLELKISPFGQTRDIFMMMTQFWAKIFFSSLKLSYFTIESPQPTDPPAQNNLMCRRKYD